MKLAFVSLAALALAGAASAQEVGAVVEGRALAESVCAECHAVGPDAGVMENPPPLPWEPDVGPLAFEDVANTPGVTALALNAWLTSSHPSMPNIILEADQRADLIAYILSLRDGD